MSDPQIGGLGGVGTQPSPVTTSHETIHATKPGRMNRSSIMKMLGVEPRLAKAQAGTRCETKPLSEYKITRQEGDVDKAVGRLANQSELSKTLTKNRGSITNHQDRAAKFEAVAGSRKDNEWAVDALKAELNEIGKLEKSALKEAKSGLKKIAVAEFSQTQVSTLSPAEVEAVKQLEEVRELKAEYKEVQAGARKHQARFKEERSIGKQLETTMKGLESKLTKARAKLDGKRISESGAGHQARVDSLKSARSEVATLAKEVQSFEKKVGKTVHGAVSEELSNRLKTMTEKMEPLKQEASEKLTVAKTERDVVVSEEKKAAKQKAKDDKAFSREVGKQLRQDSRQGRGVQKQHEARGKKSQSAPSSPIQSRKSSTRTSSSAPNTPTPTRKSAPARQESVAKPDSKPQLKRSDSVRRSSVQPKPQSTTTHTKSAGTLFATKSEKFKLSEGTPLAGGLMDTDLIPHMTGIRGTTKTFAQLEKQIFSFETLDDLKQIIADRHASKLTVSQQGKYYGLMLRAVAGAPKRPAIAKEMTEDFIRVVLKNDRTERNEALKNLDKAQVEVLEKRLSDLKKRD